MALTVDRKLSYCAGMVRETAPERYLAALLAPTATRETLFALYAFDQEIGKVRHVTSQPMAGLIRLQWWRDALDAIAADRPAPAHPVAEALQTVLSAAPDCRALLDAALNARERELEDPPPANLTALEQQIEGSSATIVQTALVILGAGDAATLEVGRKIGVVVGVLDRLRSLEADLRQGRLLLPIAELTRHGIDPKATAEVGQDLAPVIATIAGHGLDQLRAARAGRRLVPAAALPALLPGTLAGPHLRRLRRTRSVAGAKERTPFAPLRLLWHRTRGQF